MKLFILFVFMISSLNAQETEARALTEQSGIQGPVAESTVDGAIRFSQIPLSNKG